MSILLRRLKLNLTCRRDCSLSQTVRQTRNSADVGDGAVRGEHHLQYNRANDLVLACVFRVLRFRLRNQTGFRRNVLASIDLIATTTAATSAKVAAASVATAAGTNAVTFARSNARPVTVTDTVAAAWA